MKTFLGIVLDLSLLATVVALVGVLERTMRGRPKRRWVLVATASGLVFIFGVLAFIMLSDFVGGLVLTLIVGGVGFGVYLIVQHRQVDAPATTPPHRIPEHIESAPANRPGPIKERNSEMVRVPGFWGWALNEHVTPEEARRMQADKEEGRAERIAERTARKEQRRARQEEAQADRERRRRGSKLARDRGPLISLSSQEALDDASAYMTGKGFTVESRSGASVTFANYKRPDSGIGCFLLLLAIVPGILYFALAGRQVRSTLVVTPAGAYCRAQIGGESNAGYRYLRKWRDTLPPPNTPSGAVD